MSAHFDLEQTDRLLSTTRAVRRRLDLERPVERKVILDCLRLSQQAPTGSNSQKWRWMVVLDEAKRRELGAIYARGKPIIDHGKAQLDADDSQMHRVFDSTGWLIDHMAEVPVMVIPCLEVRLQEGTPHALTASTYGSIFPAVWSFQLALRSRGLGSTLTTIHLLFEAEVAKLLGIPNDIMQVALLPVAYTVGTEFKPAARPPVETITSFDEWKSN